MIEAVVFDLDGTLVNIPINYNMLSERIREVTKAKNVESLTKTLQTLNKKERQIAFEIWTNEELQALPKMTINDKGMKLYETYSNKPLVLITMQGRETVDRIVKKLKLNFQFVITREDSLDRAEQIKIAIGKLKTTPRKVLIIGNRESDYTAAQKVGCNFLRIRNENMV